MNTFDDSRELTDHTPTGGRALGAWFGLGEPHLARGPFIRWPRAADWVLACTVFVASLVAVAVSALDDDEAFTMASMGDRPAGAVLLLGLAATALSWRRQRPITVTVCVLVVMIGWAVAGYGDGQELALIVAIYSVGRSTIDQRRALATLLAVIAVGLLGTIIDSNQRVDVAPAILVAGVPWYVGRRIRNRGDYLALLEERAERLDAEQEARAHQAVADERSRIARELHDIVAHRVSLMTVQAGAAKTVARHDLDAAVDAMGDVERAGRQALGELRHLVGVLRPDAIGPDELGPQPGLAEIPGLVDELSDTGAEVTCSLGDLTVGLDAAIGLSAYRIVQESLTNIIKHAGPNPKVQLTIEGGNDGLVIDIRNSTVAAAPGLPVSGYGIVGMRERATLLGGSLAAGLQPQGQFRVLAHLPLDQEQG